ncbi:hypothetical protein MICA_1760 [Micavibrio aeruginosavorus ARL-13]|uniref:Uncharacterized protein n=1 Tax=Micavibrio aeruginosavorus (strain ARL-13) TaxID=856793 RepID=G2KRW4_MICAA|nr:hypothetical protein MICA_1760 [Micavibrio aeruginosavorus ARL-13]
MCNTLFFMTLFPYETGFSPCPSNKIPCCAGKSFYYNKLNFYRTGAKSP